MEYRTPIELIDRLSPAKVADMDTQEFITMLMDDGIVKEEKDIRLLILEGIIKILGEESSDFPIHYYEDGEPFSKEEYLTDDYISQNMV